MIDEDKIISALIKTIAVVSGVFLIVMIAVSLGFFSDYTEKILERIGFENLYDYISLVLLPGLMFFVITLASIAFHKLLFSKENLNAPDEHQLLLPTDEVLDKCVLLSTDEALERCVLCGKMTDIPKDRPIAHRVGYIEGCGQLCKGCYRSTYM